MKADLITTTARLETPDGGNITFSIELPAGLAEVSGLPAIKHFSREKPTLEDPKSFDGYSFEVHQSDPFLLTFGLGALSAMAQGGGAARRDEVLLVQETNADGFLQAKRVERPAKSEEAAPEAEIIVMRLVVRGGVALLCRGGHTGPQSEPPDVTEATLIAACRSLKITGG